MVETTHDRPMADRAKAIYAERLRSILERDHLNEFVAIEPDSGDFFVGKTMSEAIDAARVAHPDRITHTIRIGHAAAIEIGRLS